MGVELSDENIIAFIEKYVEIAAKRFGGKAEVTQITNTRTGRTLKNNGVVVACDMKTLLCSEKGE